MKWKRTVESKTNFIHAEFMFKVSSSCILYAMQYVIKANSLLHFRFSTRHSVYIYLVWLDKCVWNWAICGCRSLMQALASWPATDARSPPNLTPLEEVINTIIKAPNGSEVWGEHIVWVRIWLASFYKANDKWLCNQHLSIRAFLLKLKYFSPEELQPPVFWVEALFL